MKNELEPTFSLRQIKYDRDGEHAIDNVHLLMPFAVGKFEYSIPTDSSDTVLRLINFLFSSLDEDERFDNDNFQKLLGGLKNHTLTMESMVKEEFLSIDFLVFCTFKAHHFLEGNVRLKEGGDAGVRLCLLLLQRVLGSFQSIAILIKNSMYFDINCLLRAVLEQIGHAYQIIPAQSFDEADSFISTKGITALKEIIPDAGELNGLLSNFIHNNKKIWSDFFEIDEGSDIDDNKAYILSRSGKQTKYCMVYFTRIIEAYLAVLENIYLNYPLFNNDDKRFEHIIIASSDQISTLKKDLAKKYF